MKKHTDPNSPLTPYTDAAARIRMIAIRATEEYRKRNERPPDYVKAARRVGLEPRKARASKVKEPKADLTKTVFV
jgi:hypothetical protein